MYICKEKLVAWRVIGGEGAAKIESAIDAACRECGFDEAKWRFSPVLVAFRGAIGRNSPAAHQQAAGEIGMSPAMAASRYMFVLPSSEKAPAPSSAAHFKRAAGCRGVRPTVIPENGDIPTLDIVCETH